MGADRDFETRAVPFQDVERREGADTAPEESGLEPPGGWIDELGA
jgi:hypothetical protein